MPYEESRSREPITIESVSVVPVDFEDNERWLGVTVCFSDGIYAYAFCLSNEVEEILNAMVAARGLDGKDVL